MPDSPASPLEAPSLEEIQNRLLSEMTKLCGLLVESKNPSPRLKEAEEIIAALPARFEVDRANSAVKNKADSGQVDETTAKRYRTDRKAGSFAQAPARRAQKTSSSACEAGGERDQTALRR